MDNKPDNLSSDQPNIAHQKTLELNFSEEQGVANMHPSQIDLGPYVQSGKPEKPFRSRFNVWIKAIAAAVLLVFIPEQASWAFNYNPMVLWGDKSSYPSQSASRPYDQPANNLVSEQIATSIKNLLDQVAYQDNAQVKLELPSASLKDKQYSLLLKNSNSFNDSYISQISTWLRDPSIHPLNCGVYSLKDILKAQEIDITLEELSVTSLAVDLMSDIVKPGEEKLKTSLYAISKIVNAYGLSFKNAKLAPEDVIKLEPPFIANFKNEHFVTVTKVDSNKIYFNDIGVPAYLSKDAFVSELSGFVLANNLDGRKDLSIEFIPDSAAAFVWGNKWHDRSDDLPGFGSDTDWMWGIVFAAASYGLGQVFSALYTAGTTGWLNEVFKFLADTFSMNFTSWGEFAATFNFSKGLTQFSQALSMTVYLKCEENRGSNCADKAMYIGLAISVGGSLLKGAAIDAGAAKDGAFLENFAKSFLSLKTLNALASMMTSYFVQDMVVDALNNWDWLTVEDGDEDDTNDQLTIFGQAFLGVVSGAAGNMAGFAVNAGLNFAEGKIDELFAGELRKNVITTERAWNDATDAVNDAKAEAKTNPSQAAENKVLEAERKEADAKVKFDLAKIAYFGAVLDEMNVNGASQEDIDEVLAELDLTQHELTLDEASLSVVDAKLGKENENLKVNLEAEAKAKADLKVVVAKLNLADAKNFRDRVNADPSASAESKIEADTEVKIAEAELAYAEKIALSYSASPETLNDLSTGNKSVSVSDEGFRIKANEDRTREINKINDEKRLAIKSILKNSEYGEWLDKNGDAGFLSRFLHALTMDTGDGKNVYSDHQSVEDMKAAEKGSNFWDELKFAVGMQLNNVLDVLLGIAIKAAYIEVHKWVSGGKELKQDSLILGVAEMTARGLMAWGAEIMAQNYAENQLDENTENKEIVLGETKEDMDANAQAKYDALYREARDQGFFALALNAIGLTFLPGVGEELEAGAAFTDKEKTDTLAKGKGDTLLKERPAQDKERFDTILIGARSGDWFGFAGILTKGVLGYVVAKEMDLREEKIIKDGDKEGIYLDDEQKVDLAASRIKSLLLLGSINAVTDTVVDMIQENRTNAILGALSKKGLTAEDLKTLNSRNKEDKHIGADFLERWVGEIYVPLSQIVMNDVTLNGTDTLDINERAAYERGGATWDMTPSEISVRRQFALMGRWQQQANKSFWGNVMKVANLKQTEDTIEEKTKERNAELMELGYTDQLKSDKDVGNQVIVATFDTMNHWRTGGYDLFDATNGYLSSYLTGEASPFVQSIESAVTGVRMATGEFDATPEMIKNNLERLRAVKNESEEIYANVSRGRRDKIVSEQQKIIDAEANYFVTSLVNPFDPTRNQSIFNFLTIRASFRNIKMGIGEDESTYLLAGHMGYAGRDRSTGERKYDGMTFGADMLAFGPAGEWLFQKESGITGEKMYVDFSRFSAIQKQRIFGMTADTVGLSSSSYGFKSLNDLRDAAEFDGQYVFTKGKDGKNVLLTDENAESRLGLDDNYIRSTNAKGVDVVMSLGEVCDSSGNCFNVDFTRTASSVGNNIPDNFSLGFNKINGSDSAGFLAAHEAYWNARGDDNREDAMILGQNAYNKARFLTNTRGFYLESNWATEDAKKYANMQTDDKLAKTDKLNKLQEEMKGLKEDDPVSADIKVIQVEIDQLKKDLGSFKPEDKEKYREEQLAEREQQTADFNISEKVNVYNVVGASEFESKTLPAKVTISQNLELFIGTQKSSGGSQPTLMAGLSPNAFQYSPDDKTRITYLMSPELLRLYTSVNFYMNDSQLTESAKTALVDLQNAIVNDKEGLLVKGTVNSAKEIIDSIGLDSYVTEPAKALIDGSVALKKDEGLASTIKMSAANQEAVYNQKVLLTKSDEFLTAPISLNVGQGRVDLGNAMSVITRDNNGLIYYRALTEIPSTSIVANKAADRLEKIVAKEYTSEGFEVQRVVLLDAIDPRGLEPKNADGETVDIETIINDRALYDVFLLNSDGDVVSGEKNRSRALFGGFTKKEWGSAATSDNLVTEGGEEEQVWTKEDAEKIVLNSIFSLRYNPKEDRVTKAGITQGFLKKNETDAAKNMGVTNTVLGHTPYLVATKGSEPNALQQRAGAVDLESLANQVNGDSLGA
ncbi:MAG: hypothetical protein KBD53_11040, partial [Candidatus Omnitrophica bacterium]|nr:hypothetical protein [Candidatus Omnitrophota bacterium]